MSLYLTQALTYSYTALSRPYRQAAKPVRNVGAVVARTSGMGISARLKGDSLQTRPTYAYQPGHNR